MRLIRVAVRLRPLLVVALLAAAPAAAQEPPADPAVALRDLLAAGAPPVTDIDAALGADALSALRAFYATRQDRPFWTETAAAEAGRRLAALKDMIAPGMRPLLQAATARPSDAQGDVQGGAARDLMLSAIYGSVAIDPAAPDRAAGLGPALRALGQASDPVAQLTKTLPAYPGFWRLRTALTAYRAQAAAGGWGNVPDGVKLMRGGGADSDSESEGAGPRVEALRRRLAAGGDLVAAGTGPFDPALESGVVKFQARHGLKTDGIAGARTIEALNIPMARRIATLEINLARQQRRDWGDRYIAVNIAAASYRLVLDGKVVFERPAVVGRPGWPTPVLDGLIDKVEFHPFWRVPMRIADEELWPKQDADANYFSRNGIHVVDDQLVQDPGPANPLGAVKFVFDNPFSVYLHDTTAPALFQEPWRFASHGCVRVASAGDLARQLLGADPSWSADKVEAALERGGHQTVPLANPIPIHIVYDTAWVDEDGTVQFRDDVYRLDQPVRGDAGGVPVAAGTPTGTCEG